MAAEWIHTRVTADLLRGATEVEPTAGGVLPHRLPAWARRQFPNEQLLMVESQPSGVRLVLRTAATAIELDTLPTKRAYLGAPLPPDGVYDLVVDGRLLAQATVPGGNILTIDMAGGTTTLQDGDPGTARFTDLPEGVKDVEIWLPHNETTELRELRTNAPVEPATESGRPVWLHHGSSISHGSNAASPTTTWPALAARAAGVDLVNLGFGGSALLDQFTARTMRDTPADLISVKLGINVVNIDLMHERAFTSAVHGFLDTIRDGHPTTPLLVVSPILCPVHESTPGPTAPDMEAMARGEVKFLAAGDPAGVPYGRLTLEVIRRELAAIVAQRADPNLHYLDGLELYGPADYDELPLPDELHPDAGGHRRIGERFATVFADGGAFASGEAR